MKQKPVANSSKIAVTFEMPADLQCEDLRVVGDFNNWDPGSTPMKRLKDGSWSTTLRLAPGTYRFRYRDGNERWYNDPAADHTEDSGFGSENSVLQVEPSNK